MTMDIDLVEPVMLQYDRIRGVIWLNDSERCRLRICGINTGCVLKSETGTGKHSFIDISIRIPEEMPRPLQIKRRLLSKLKALWKHFSNLWR